MGETVIFTAAVMDLCHEGHINLLKKMREKGRVIVVLHDDESVYKIKGKIPIQPLEQRMRNLQITGLVDEIYATYSTEPTEQFEMIIRMYPDAIFMRGDDNKTPPGFSVIKNHKIKTIFIPYTKGISSSKIRKRLLN